MGIDHYSNMIMSILNMLKARPKLSILVGGVVVISLFSAAENGKKPMNYHSSEEILQFHFMEDGSLPDGTSEFTRWHQ